LRRCSQFVHTDDIGESALRTAVKRIQAELEKIDQATISFHKMDVCVDRIELVFSATRRWAEAVRVA
jgi:hypothetical protein